MTPGADIEPGPHWWKASALTTRPTLPPLSVQVSYNLALLFPYYLFIYLLLLLLLLLFACFTYFIFVSSTLVKTVITNPLPSQISAIKGLPKLLPCGVQSDPAITVQWHWTKDGSDVDASRMQLQNDGTLRIVAVRESDAGTYVCLVKSRGGNATTSGTLSVQGVWAVCFRKSTFV